MSKKNSYSPMQLGGQKEVDLVNTFKSQRDDSKLYFTQCIKPRLDRSYKLYIADNTDRSKQIDTWQANVCVPYINAVVETLKPRILDARPDFTVQGRNPEDQPRASKVQSLADYTWEIAGADKTAELLTSASLIYGMGYMQLGWKRDVRENKFLVTKKLDKKKYEWKKEKRVFYDAPFIDWVDNYSLWYDWHNTNGESKQYWFKRLLLSEDEIRRKYPMADDNRLDIAFTVNSGDLVDYASIRQTTKLSHESIVKGADRFSSTGAFFGTDGIYQNNQIKMHEVFERLRPFADGYDVWVNDVPVLKGATMPNPYDFKESFFVGVPYLKIPGEYEGYGIPMLLENPQIMLNTIKNQRLDAMTLNIHRMWIVNPLANIKKEELVIRPMGIIYSPDPNGAREIQVSDIKPSAYREEELLKSDMRYSSGVDDFSMGAGGGSASATEVRHLRESTLERVRLFVNHLGEGYATAMRYCISMWRQFYSKEIVMRITGDNGQTEFPIIDKDDLSGEFDFKATVIPSIAGQNDIKKKQDMDLFQLLVTLPFIDPEKLTSKMLHDWNWNIESIIKKEEGVSEDTTDLTPEEMAAQGLDAQGMTIESTPEELGGGQIPADVVAGVLKTLGDNSMEGAGNPAMAQLGAPINLLNPANATPPTAAGIKTPQTTNPRGLNRGGKVNTNIPTKQPANPEAQLQNRALNIQR